MRSLIADRLPVVPKAGSRQRIPSLAGAAEALWVAQLVRECNRPVLFICRDMLSADHLFEELSFLAPELAVSLLPEWDVLPYDLFSPTPDITLARINALSDLLDEKKTLTITTAPAAVLPYAPPAHIAAHTFRLRIGDTLSLPAFIRRLQKSHYNRVDRVLVAGDFAVYGGQIDVFPPRANAPFRLLLFDDTVEEIRLFDPQTQRSTGKTAAVELSAMSECDVSEAGITHFKHQLSKHFSTAHASWVSEVRGEALPAGVEFLLPLFYPHCARLFDYLSADCLILMHQDCQQGIEAFLKQARLRQKMASVYEHRPALPVATLFLSEPDFFTRLRHYPVLVLSEVDAHTSAPKVAVNPRVADSHRALIDFLSTFSGQVVIALSSSGRCQALAALLRAAHLPICIVDSFADFEQSPITLVVAPLRGDLSCHRRALRYLLRQRFLMSHCHRADVFGRPIMCLCQPTRFVRAIWWYTEIMALDVWRD